MIPAVFLFLLLFMAYQKPKLLHLPVHAEVEAKEPSSTATPTPNNSPVTHGVPIHITIPVINVDAAIIPMGASKNDIMEAPSSITDVGWYKLGVFPGDGGSALLDGHVDGKNGEPGVFANLSELQPKDQITVNDEDGNLTHFTVREVWTYKPNVDTEELFNQGDGAHLILITCNGSWDAVKHSYTKRLVVIADAGI